MLYAYNDLIADRSLNMQRNMLKILITKNDIGQQIFLKEKLYNVEWYTYQYK